MRLLIFFLLFNCSSTERRGDVYIERPDDFEFQPNERNSVPWNEGLRREHCKQSVINKTRKEVGRDFELVLARSTYKFVKGIGPMCLYNYIEYKMRTPLNKEDKKAIDELLN